MTGDHRRLGTQQTLFWTAWKQGTPFSFPFLVLSVTCAAQIKGEKKRKRKRPWIFLSSAFIFFPFFYLSLFSCIGEQYSSRRKESEKGNTLYWGGGQRQETEKWTFDFYSSKKLTFLFATSQRCDAYYCCLFFSYGLSSFPT